MKLRSAFILRVLELCERENLTLYELAKRAGLPKSTLQSALDPERGNPGMKTAEAVFEGLRVSAREFFDSELFL
ncbi:MAG: helix-turn-helix transcriptional regulator [Stomatobaculum sp.]|nr:helix-turn-helix transcriptional regulator [Stomatobaculum sp.]